MLSAATNAKRPPETGDREMQVSMVAGARNHHYRTLIHIAASRRIEQLSYRPQGASIVPQAEFEPATLRLTEATPASDRARPSVTKIMTMNDLRASSARGSISIDRRK
jgi:hypothetical protein